MPAAPESVPVPAAAPAPAPEPWRPKLYGDRQWSVFHAREQIVLVHGPRFAGKSWVMGHKVVKHLWETPGAQYSIWAKSVKLAKDAGSWQLILDHIIPEWSRANLVTKDGEPFEILSRTAEGLPGPKVDANTRTAYFDLRNYYGGRSRCWLFSINNENEIEEKVKNKNFSGMWFIELSMWKERKLLPITLASLRMPGFSLHEDNFLQWMADTNPDEVLGRNSWIYQVFMVERNKPATEAGTEEQELLVEYYKMMGVYYLHWKDNPFFTHAGQVKLLGSCRGEPALKEAYYDGVWGQGGFQSKFHFRHLFLRAKHVVGDGDDQIDVVSSSTQLKSGWDIGSVNHACILLDKWARRVGDKEKMCWSVLEEIVHIGEGLSHDECIQLDAFTQLVLAAMAEIERKENRPFTWQHYADDSALNVFRPNSDNPYDYLEIAQASEGLITLEGVHKPAHSRRTRVRMVSALLREERLFVSARCAHVIAMLEHLAQSDAQYIVRNEHIHVFDALSYPIFKELSMEWMEDSFRPHATRKTPENSGGIISI